MPLRGGAAVRIGLTGAQSVGKSTLAREISKRLGLPLIEEQARVVVGDLGIERPCNLKGRPQLSKRFQWECLMRQIEVEKQLNAFIADRTVMDNAAYWIKWRSGRSSSRDNLDYYLECEKHSRSYELVFYLPPEIPLYANGFRSTNAEYRDEMDWLIRTVVRGLIEPSRLAELSGTLEERVERVLALVEKVWEDGSIRAGVPAMPVNYAVPPPTGIEDPPERM
jgi:nicotinamide riboside kinase